jgi:hypothetical protein
VAATFNFINEIIDAFNLKKKKKKLVVYFATLKTHLTVLTVILYC